MRALPIQQAFIQLIDKETHHIQRNVIQKKAIIIGYGDLSNEEKEIFIQLIQRNAKNMCFKDFRVVFSKEEQLEQIVNNEVQLWVK